MNTITTDIKQADIKHTISQLDTTIAKINTVINDVQTQQGTIGKLLYDTTLYQHIDATILSADSLITDIKKQPKKYINISVFGK
jgi:phospholipid/cholesterol/gamma-HCH transport system substrate-binding protein